MNKFSHYFNDLFKKFDIVFMLVFIFLVSFAAYQNDLIINDGNGQMVVLVLLSIPALLGIINLGNLKKNINLADCLSIVFMLIYVYFAISTPMGGIKIYAIVMPVILFIETILRVVYYPLEASCEKNPSKEFFSRLNYRFPLVVLVVIGFAIAFSMYYVLANLDMSVQFFTTIGLMSSILISLLYLAIVHILDSHYVSILDYVYFTMACFLAGVILLIYPAIMNQYVFLLLTVPFLTICLRACTFEGESIQLKKKYVSKLLEKFHIVAPFVLGFAMASIIVYSSFNSLLDLNQSIYLLVFSVISLILTITLICIKGIKSKKIQVIDYILFFSISILFLVFIYILAVTLGIYGSDFRKEIFSDLFSLIGIFIFMLCLLTNIVIYFIRYKHYMGKDLEEEKVQEIESTVVEQLDEDNEEDAEPIVESEDEMVESEENEDNEEDAEPIVESEDEMVESEENEPQEISEPEEPSIQEDVAEPVMEEPQEEKKKAPSSNVRKNSKYPEFVIPEDESTNHLTKLKYTGKLMFAEEKIKNLYSDVKNELLSYGLSSRISNTKETFKKKETIAVLKTNGKSLSLYLAILPDPLMEGGYPVQDLSSVKEYEETPTMLRIKTKKNFKQFKEILDILMTHKEITKESDEKTDYVESLIPDGEAILNGLGYASDNLVSSVNAKILPADMPKDLDRFIPFLNQSPLPENAVTASVYLDTLCNHFDDEAVINKDILIEKNLIKDCDAFTVKSRGTLDKKLKIYADEFDKDAVKMIYITGGTAVLIKHENNE